MAQDFPLQRVLVTEGRSRNIGSAVLQGHHRLGAIQNGGRHRFDFVLIGVDAGVDLSLGPAIAEAVTEGGGLPGSALTDQAHGGRLIHAVDPGKVQMQMAGSSQQVGLDFGE